MSALAQQHQSWASARERLWGMPPRRIIMLPAPDRVVLPGWAAPFNFLTIPSPASIIKLVALKHGLSVKVLKGRSHRPCHTRPRQEAMMLIYDHCDLSLSRVGRLLSHRDHSTVLYGVRQARKRLSTQSTEKAPVSGTVLGVAHSQSGTCEVLVAGPLVGDYLEDHHSTGGGH